MLSWSSPSLGEGERSRRGCKGNREHADRTRGGGTGTRDVRRWKLTRSRENVNSTPDLEPRDHQRASTRSRGCDLKRDQPPGVRPLPLASRARSPGAWANPGSLVRRAVSGNWYQPHGGPRGHVTQAFALRLSHPPSPNVSPWPGYVWHGFSSRVYVQSYPLKHCM